MLNKKGQTYFIDVLILTILFLLVLLCFQVRAETLIKTYTYEQLSKAIYLAEGGKGYDYGIKSVNYKDEAEAKRICINTIRNNVKRYKDYGYKKHPNYLEFLASRYCPIGAKNDPGGLNKNWLKNVKFFLNKQNPIRTRKTP